MKILIVEDEIKTGEYLSKGLVEAEYMFATILSVVTYRE